MFFTHTAATHRYSPDGPRLHCWTDVRIAQPVSIHNRIRATYRQLRRLGLSPNSARGVIFDMVVIGYGDTTLSDHDCWRVA